MDFSFSAEQKLFRREVRSFLEQEFSLARVRQLETDAVGWPRELYRRMAELGWLGFMLPEELGGPGFGFLEVALFYEELGRALFPSPHYQTLIQAGHALLHGGGAGRKRLLKQMAAGEITATVAGFEPGEGSGPEAVQARARPEGGDLVLDGVKVYVPWANSVDYLLTLVRTAAPGPEAEGVSLVLVPAKAAGLSLAAHRVIGGERSFEVTFAGARVAGRNLVGPLHRGWPLWLEMEDRGKVAAAAEMIGGAERALELAKGYARERVQFGQPIGKFQAIQHLLAPPFMELDGARLLLYEAAGQIDQGRNARERAAMAKAWANHVYQAATQAGHQTLGGFGFMLEADMQLFYRRAKGLEINRGATPHQLDLIAAGLSPASGPGPDF
jgi:alkylation response protein AidB-like acyl-CoA dehydrogenase